MKITGVRTHLVHCPIPEEHRVRSGAGYKLARDYGLTPRPWQMALSETLEALQTLDTKCKAR